MIHSAGITAIVKCTYLVTLSDQTDRFYALPPLFMWAAAEDALAIIASTIPTLRPLLSNKSAHNSNAHTYPLQEFDKANDAFYPGSYRAEVNTTIEARSGNFVPGEETVVSFHDFLHGGSYLTTPNGEKLVEPTARRDSDSKGQILATTRVETSYA